MIRRATFTVTLVFLTIVSMFGVQSQTLSRGAILRVTYDSVIVNRTGTTNPIELPPSSQSAIGTGDVLTTTTYGRAFIDFDAARLFVLPESQLSVDDYTDGTLTVTLNHGRMFLNMGGESFSSIILNAGTLVISAITPTSSIGLEVLPGGISTVISGVGSSTGTVNGREFTLTTGEGVRSNPLLGDSAVTALPPPYNFARLDSLMNGCPGQIEARGEASLNVRVGPGLDFDTLGSIPNGTPVYLMAENPTSARYRVQFLSGYGWVLANGVRHRCIDLAVLPSNSIESIVRLLYATPEEQELLFPFYGAPDDDEIFYILPETND